MRLRLLSEERVRLEVTPGALSVEADAEDTQYSPFHMVAGGLAFCTFSVLYSWAGNAHLEAEDLAIEVAWEFADDPYRVGRYEMDLIWPSLPEGRRQAAERVAALCPLHGTLLHSPEVQTRVRTA